MRTLYISDLDGTLLNSQKYLSQNTIRIMNRLVDAGIWFTLSTARTPASSFLWSALRLNLPISTTNGVLTVDGNNHFLKCKPIASKDIETLCRILAASGQTALLYVYDMVNSMETCYYAGQPSPILQEFIDERSVPPFTRYKRFERISSYTELTIQPVVFGSMTGHLPELQELEQQLCRETNLHIYSYQDSYHPGNYYLEFNAASVSKAVAAQELKEQLGADKLVVFGDNTNDLPMFSIADESYATANATDDAKEAATAVIDSCDEDGVARWMQENCIV